MQEITCRDFDAKGCRMLLMCGKAWIFPVTATTKRYLRVLAISGPRKSSTVQPVIRPSLLLGPG